MPRVCSTCQSKHRAHIDEALLAGTSYSAIAREFGVGRDSLRRHAGAHLPAALVKGAEAHEVARGDSLLVQVEDLRKKASGLFAEASAVLARAKREGDGPLVLESVRTASTALKEARGLVGLLSETAIALLAGEQSAQARLRAEVESAIAAAETALDPASFTRLCRAWAALPGAGPERTGDDCNG